ncbi:helix-turn-helix domain-containing protein [Blautia producta]|uniref:helix-turn-helix domain-containing protein n=1 Tax=Blautia producta TaxID=33035 RepID=UPI00356A12F1
MTKILQDINLGVNLKRLRMDRGLTQEALCARMGIEGRPMSQSNYALIESGKRNIFLSDLITIKEILNISYDELFDGLTPLSRYEEEHQ